MANRSNLVLAVATLALGGMLGYFLASSRIPADLLIPGRPTTLHLYRFDPTGGLPKPGNGETVIFDQHAISRIADEVNRLPFSNDCSTVRCRTLDVLAVVRLQQR